MIYNNDWAFTNDEGIAALNATGLAPIMQFKLWIVDRRRDNWKTTQQAEIELLAFRPATTWKRPF